MPASRTLSRSTTQRSAGAPAHERRRRRSPPPRSDAGPVEAAPPVASRSSSSTARASSNRSTTAWESVPSAERHRRPQGGGRPDAVGEVALGRRAQADRGARCAEQRDVAVGDVGAVDRGRRRPEDAAVVRRAASGVRPVAARHASFSRRLLRQVQVQRHRRVPRPVGHRCHRRGVDGPHAVDRGADGDVGVGGRDLLGPGRPAVDVAVAEPPLHGIEVGAVEAGAEVAGVEQHEPDAGRGAPPRRRRRPSRSGWWR